MQSNTRTAIAAILAADASIPKETANRALAILDGADVPRPMGRVIRTTEAARILGVTTKTARAYAAAGALVSVYGPGNKLRTGYTEESVRALAEGRARREDVERRVQAVAHKWRTVEAGGAA